MFIFWGRVLKTKVEAFLNEVQELAKAGGKVCVLAASKTQSLDSILEIHRQGIVHFGENYVQEGLEKIQAYQEQALENIVWHLIGPLQSNKAKVVAAHFDWVDSVHSEKLLNRLNQYRTQDQKPLNVCLQVNIDRAPTKNGFEPNIELLKNVVKQAAELSHINIRGLLVMPDDHPQDVLLDYFHQAKKLFDELVTHFGHKKFDTLSMGMSSDYQLAIRGGSSMIRVGSLLFGKRS